MPTSPSWTAIVRGLAAHTSGGLRFGDEALSWPEVLRAGAERAAALHSLVERPAGRQVHVGLLMENLPEHVHWLVACALADATAVGINASRSAIELAGDIRHADVDLLVVQPELRHLLDGDHGVPAERVLELGHPAYAALLAAHEGAAAPGGEPGAGSIAALLFSSGSTGAPKAVIMGQERMGRLVPVLVDRVRLRPDSVTYLCTPLFHGNALLLNLAPAMLVGATVVLAQRFSASRFSADVHRHGVTMVNYVGRMLSYVLMAPEDPRDRGSTLELAFGTEASDTDAAAFAERFGCEVSEGYGMSEGVFRINRTSETPSGALGRPVGVDVRILDEDGNECPRAVFDADGRLVDQAAVGEMVAIGMAPAFEGYYRNPEAMADRVRGQHYWSGDLAYRDEDGWFWFAGRRSDWLRVDSENFAAGPVERIMLRVPGVAAAPVYAVPDPVTGDRLMVALDLEPGVEFDASAFAAFLAAQPDLGVKWWPSFVRVVGEFPLTGSGKVDKAPLRRQAWETTDPVFERVGRPSAPGDSGGLPRFVPVDDDRRRALADEFRAHGRAALLP